MRREEGLERLRTCLKESDGQLFAKSNDLPPVSPAPSESPRRLLTLSMVEMGTTRESRGEWRVDFFEPPNVKQKLDGTNREIGFQMENVIALRIEKCFLIGEMISSFVGNCCTGEARDTPSDEARAYQWRAKSFHSLRMDCIWVIETGMYILNKGKENRRRRGHVDAVSAVFENNYALEDGEDGKGSIKQDERVGDEEALLREIGTNHEEHGG